MRTRHFVMVAAFLLVSGGARAQQLASDADQQDVPKATLASSIPDVTLANQIDFGVRGTSFGANSDQARFQRYRDLTNGGTLDLLRFSKDTASYGVNFQADHVGYRDQRFAASYNDYGKLKVAFEWNQVPLFYSNTTASLYTSSTPGVLLLPDAVQSGLQNKTTTLPSVVTGASVFDTQSKRNNGSFNLLYNASQNVDFGLTFKNSQRSGTQPYAMSFGISGAIASEFALPLDQRTSELGASMQWSNEHGLAKLGYDGSFFRNNIPTLSVDNPGRITDSATLGPLFGRMAMSPNSNLNTVSALGSLNLPAHSHASGYLSISNMTQNDALLPFTSNTALVSPTLDRPTADLTARVTSMNYSFTSRPTNFVWLSARYRQYEFDNRSPAFFVGNSIYYDTNVTPRNEFAERLGFTRRTFDADASLTPFKYVGFRAGYTRENIDHTNPSTNEATRMVDKTAEDTYRASVDATGISWLTLRGVYEHANRVGSGLDTQMLIDIGEQPTLRQYDIADRTKDSFRGIVTVIPVSQFSVNASAGVGKEDYPATTANPFGLRNNDNHVYSIGFDYVPTDKVSAGVSYGYEKYSALQTSRTANPLPANTLQYLNDPTQQFNDPNRNWSDNSADKVNTWNASVDLLKVIPKTEVRLGYDYSRAQSTYLYSVATSVIAAPVQLPAVTNQLQRGTLDARYFLTQHLAVGLAYWYDKYDVNDFALGPTPSLSSPATASASLMLMGYSYRPYTANTFWGKFSYLW
jgi:MtrB/PioB family decaheme-associated outer membrane protein